MAFADLVVPDENGHLAETPVEVARAVESYLASPALAARHAARGRDLAVEHAWAHLAERVERILREAALPATHVEENARDRHV
jgi:ribosomal protein L22